MNVFEELPMIFEVPTAGMLSATNPAPLFSERVSKSGLRIHVPD
ncbi:MAG: hypothetical protein ABJQ70_20625 [Roseobacter sp.]